MHYQYRFLFAFVISLLIIIGAFFGDLKPRLRHVKEGRTTEKKLSTQLFSLQKTASHHQEPERIAMPPQRSPIERMAELLSLAEAAQLTVRSIKIAASTAEEVTVYCSIQGNFPAMAAFIQQLSEQSPPGLPTHFSLVQTDQQHLVATFTFVLLAYPLGNAHANSYLSPQDPFCYSQNKAVLPAEAAVLQAFPLALIKLVGYIEQSSQQRAFLRLPTNEVVSVALGDVLGKERGMVTEMDSSHLLIVMPGQKQWLLKMTLTS